MSAFAPIAIVGRGCVLPGAATPEALFEAVLQRRVLVAPTPQGRWRVPNMAALLRSGAVASATGGYVVHDVRNDDGAASIRDLSRLDPLVHWLLHCATAALREAKGEMLASRAGLIAGNLCYPSERGAAFVEDFWKGEGGHDARNRFSSGLPTHLVANALALGGPAFAIDAACASSLYAIKLACDRLHDGEADLMLAGGVNRADDLFLHLGFTALKALSPSGQSRPFHPEADGLVPAEGAGLVALKRLGDAERDGDRIFGVIRGVGLSNDGRQNGFLAPAVAGQTRAMEQAFAQAALEPGDIGYVECHATGTARGDAIELESLAQIYAARPAIGSLKGNIGHAITASGVASLFKMLGALEAGVLPPTPGERSLDAAASLAFAIPRAPVAWDGAARRAAISNFGFGGNNAHLIVEAWRPARTRRKAKRAPPRPCEIAICAIGVVAGGANDYASFRARLFAPRAPAVRLEEIALPLQDLGFPPADLAASLGQQTALLAAAAEALDSVRPVDPERTGVFVGMGCDTLIARHGLAVRAAVDEAWRRANAAAAPPLSAPAVLGTMPNIPANRIHVQRDFRGPGFAVASEELSGVDALQIAARALGAGELDAALVGAVDLSREPAHEAAAAAVMRATAGDAAVVLVLKRRDDARRDGDAVIACIDAAADGATEIGDEARARFGHPHAASGLLEIAAAATALAARVRIDKAGAQPVAWAQQQMLALRSFSGRAQGVALVAGDRAPAALCGAPLLWCYAASSRRALAELLASGRQSLEGDVRLTIVAASEEEAERLRIDALAALREGRLPAGVAYAEARLQGELAFTFTGAAAAYAGAGRDMLLGWPEVSDAVAARHARADALMRSFYAAEADALDPRAQLGGCALVCQAHAAFTQEVLRLKPQAAIGLSSGETNALVAFGVWRDLDAMFAEIEESGLYGRALTGACEAAAAHWGVAASVDWACWRMAAPRAEVEAALAGEARAAITIVHAPDDCVIGGEASACRRVVARIGRTRAVPLGLDMVVHAPALGPFADAWRRIHTRATHSAPDVRFYTHAGARAYAPTSEAAAEALTSQALAPIDFPATVESAYRDGVRVFVEHGPRSILTQSIGKILQGRPHLAVALDRRERNGLKPLAEAVAALWAHGVELDMAAFGERLALLRGGARPVQRMLRLAAHPPDIVATVAPEQDRPAVPVPRLEAAGGDARFAGMQIMQAAPEALAPLVLFAERAPRPVRVAQDAVAAIGAAHGAFLSRQAEVHAEFLAHRQKAIAALAAPRGVVHEFPARSPSPVCAENARARPVFTRAQLEVLAGGRIADVFGERFAEQETYRRQVRMPEPPMLLADRVMLLDGAPCSMGKGRIVTETDVQADAWYMHAGRMTPGAVIESGQADLLLASWLGADVHNCGARVYRLLGCDLTFYGGMPAAGETLRYDIHIDGHAKTGDVRLFFFHYDCHVGDRLLITVRNGQAGFFTDEELAQSGGVLWSAEEDAPKPEARCDAPPQMTTRRSFGRAELGAFVEGRAFDCFGEGFEMAAAHRRSPSLPGGKLRLIDEVVSFEPRGGPWKRGYLRARAVVAPDAWFYKGHFKNDPCMPGTLMADAATQALAFAMAALGFTIDRDGWRFEPVAGETARFLCRGQVTPDRTHVLEYEVFIEEIVDGPEPAVSAALLCRSDGLKIFQCRRFALKLVPDWPLSTRAIEEREPPRIVGRTGDVRGDHGALVACAWGRPSDAFGALYAPFDGARRAPRLPGEPYHFISRIVSVDGTPGEPVVGGTVVAEYDAPSEAWYFADGAMPLAVLTEVLLQPCGWLASFMGFAANSPDDVAFRNLDGSAATLLRPVRRGAGTLRVVATLQRFAEAGGTTIVGFSVRCDDAQGPVMTLATAFGFFRPDALRAQVGIAAREEERARLFDAPTIAAEPIGAGDLSVLNEIVAFDPKGGAAGLGRMAARAPVDPRAWFFKAHFFQDPVQPGSIGLQALADLQRAFVHRAGLGNVRADASFALGEPFLWKFRGQVTPKHRCVAAEIEVESVEHEGGDVIVRADGAYWVDGLRIYETKGMAMRAKRA